MIVSDLSQPFCGILISSILIVIITNLKLASTAGQNMMDLGKECTVFLTRMCVQERRSE